MKKTHFGAIILAAGFSSRMDGFKPLLNLGNSSILDHSIQLFLSTGIDEIILVTGHRSEDINSSVTIPELKCIYNPQYKEGMFTSILQGVKNMGDEIDAFFILPVDIPLVRSQTIIDISKTFTPPNPSVIYPTFQGVRGHPPLISHSLKRNIIEWDGAQGLQGLLKLHDNESIDVKVVDEYILHDVDNQADYQKLSSMALHHDIPTASECLELLRTIFLCHTAYCTRCIDTAKMAFALGVLMHKNGTSLCISILIAGAMLYDILITYPRNRQIADTIFEKYSFFPLKEFFTSRKKQSPQPSIFYKEMLVVHCAHGLIKKNIHRKPEYHNFIHAPYTQAYPPLTKNKQPTTLSMIYGELLPEFNKLSFETIQKEYIKTTREKLLQYRGL